VKHRKKGKKLNRSTAQRKALFRSLIQSLIFKGAIKTTEAKAKAIKSLVDKLVVKAKRGTVHARRQVMSFLTNKKAANKLVDEIAPRFKDRDSGFTRFARIGERRGDDAMMVKIEFIDHVKRGKGAKKGDAKKNKKENAKGAKK